MSVRASARFGAEAGGTALLVGFGTGTIVGGAALGGLPGWALAVAWFAAVLIPIVLFVEVSGAHLNPAVTIALAGSGRIAWAETPVYFAGQFVGAFAGSLTVLALFGPGAHLGATLPLGGDVVRTFALEFAFTALLVLAVFTLADRGEGRMRWRLALPPLVVGVSTYLIGPYTGSSLNPARSVAPAVLSSTYAFLWVYLGATVLGALVVAILWRPRTVDLLDRGPGRADASR